MHSETRRYVTDSRIECDDAEALEEMLSGMSAAFPGSRWWVSGDAHPTALGPSDMVGKWEGFWLALKADEHGGLFYLCSISADPMSLDINSWHCFGGDPCEPVECVKAFRMHVHFMFKGLAAKLKGGG